MNVDLQEAKIKQLERDLAAVTKERDEANEKASRIGTAFAQFASRVGASLDSAGIKEDELGKRVDATLARLKRLEEAVEQAYMEGWTEGASPSADADVIELGYHQREAWENSKAKQAKEAR
jgi:hypothetical protein